MNLADLQKILKERSKVAFKDYAVNEGVIEKCAAYAAREHGDARRALELLRVAAELAERSNSSKIEIEHIDQAEEKIDRDRIIDAINTQPKQFKLTLYSIFSIAQKEDKVIYTGDIYEIYKEACKRTGVNPLTQRRLSDYYPNKIEARRRNEAL